MGVYPLELRKHGPYVLSLFGNLYLEEFLNSGHIRELVADGRDVVHAVGVGQKLEVIDIFCYFLHSPVELTEDHIALGNELSLKVKEKPDRPVGSRMEGSPVENELGFLFKACLFRSLKVLKGRNLGVKDLIIVGRGVGPAVENLCERGKFLLRYPLYREILSEREVLVALPHEHPSEVLMPLKLNTEHIVGFPLRPPGTLPEV